MPLALIDYGAGNLTSVRKGFAAVGAELYTPASPGDLSRAAGIVVPGVGNFAATAALADAWRPAILDAVRAGTPLLGICLGMQWLFEGSDEAPAVPGLGLLPGRCARLRPGNLGTLGPLKVPHVGWNVLLKRRVSGLAPDILQGAYVYFTHSYAAPAGADTTFATPHSTEVPAVVERGRMFGVQFHPEKSGDTGLAFLRRFTAVAHAG